MIEIQRILCPIDLSDYSRRALDHAVAIARRYGSTITALHVFSVTPVSPYAPGAPGFEWVVLTQEDRDRVLAEVARFVDEETSPGVKIAPVVREGHSAREILSQAAAMKADLLVMGTHGRTGFERLLLGSVTEKVLRKATCPVLTVPRRHPDAVPVSPVLYRHILCAIDFSEPSIRALEYALSLAQESDARLTIVHVIADDIETPDIHDASITDDSLSLGEYRRRREDDARERLAQLIPDSASTYCSLDTMMVRGRPSSEILRIAGERESDLIVLGVRGRGAVDVLVFGSTAHQVVRGAVCPVLTVRG